MSTSSRRSLTRWGRTLLTSLLLWGTVSSVEAFLSVAGVAGAAGSALGAWRTLLTCAAVFAAARLALLWLSEDLADRERKRDAHREAASRSAREQSDVPREYRVG